MGHKSSPLWLRLWAQSKTDLRTLIFGFVVFSYVLKSIFKKLKAKNLPRIPFVKAHPIFGDFGWMLRNIPRVPKTENRPDIMAHFQAGVAATREQGLFSLSILHWLMPFSSQMVVVHDLKLIRTLLSKSSWSLYRKGKSYRIATDLIGTRGLLASPDNDLWHWQRRLLSPSFRRHLFDTVLAPSVRRSVASMCERWEEEARSSGQRPKVEFDSEASRLTLSVLGDFAFGAADFGGDALSPSGSTEDSQPLDEAFACVLRRMTSFGRNPLLFLTRWLPTLRNRRYWRALRSIDRAALASIDRRLARAESEGKVDQARLGDDLLGHVLRASDADVASGGERMDRRLLLENLRTFLFAGHDTTASALSWAMQLLASHPEEMALLRAELDGASIGAPCDIVDALPRLEAVIREVLRLYPSAGFTREPLSDVELGDYVLPKGTEIFVFPYLVHRDERLFPNPENFDPERWLSPDGKLKGGAPESLGWIPFSLGSRNCIGAQLAKLELKLTLRELLSRYDFEASLEDGESSPQVVLYMTLVPNFIRLIPHPRR